MSTIFHYKYFHLDCNEVQECVCCLEPFEDDVYVIGHENLNATNNATNEKTVIHVVHELCMKKWLKVNNSCPFCRCTLDAKNILSTKERLTHTVKNLGKAAFGELNTQSQYFTALNYIL